MILMRTLRKDYARYSKEEEMDDMVPFFLTLQFRLVHIEYEITFVGFPSLFGLDCP